jgi:hypothetical protein
VKRSSLHQNSDFEGASQRKHEVTMSRLFLLCEFESRQWKLLSVGLDESIRLRLSVARMAHFAEAKRPWLSLKQREQSVQHSESLLVT